MAFGRLPLLFTLVLCSCAGQPLATEKESNKERSDYMAPDWSEEECIALINSKISLNSQKLLLPTMKEIVEREIELFNENMRLLKNSISGQEAFLSQVISDYNGTTLADEESFLSYCAELKIRIELLKIQLYYMEDFARMKVSMERLAISLPK